MFSFIYKNCRYARAWSRRFLRRDGAAANRAGIAARFRRDRSGAYAVMFGLMTPVFIGALALGSETGLWYSTQEKMQGAADSSAISAAVGHWGRYKCDARSQRDGGIQWLCQRLRRHGGDRE